MTRVREEVSTTESMEIQQDYSPGYDIALGTDKVIEGTRIRTNPNASTGSHNLVDIDVNNQDIVDALNAAYPLAWPAMYPGTEYSFRAESGSSNALKLVKAVELWLYLNNFETTNMGFDDLEDNLEAQNVAPASGNGTVYSQYLENQTPYRIPPETMWNREVFYNEAGDRVDVDGRPIPRIEVDVNGSPIFRNLDIGSQEELDVLALGLQVAWFNNTLPQSISRAWFHADGTLVKPINDFTPEELQTIRSAAILFSPVSTILPYSPFTLHGTRRIASKVAGSHVQKLYSIEYMAGTEYESTLRQPRTEYEWGGAYAVGKSTF